jgi:hypothetical protein
VFQDADRLGSAFRKRRPIPVAALDTEAVKTGIREIVSRRPKF